MPERIDHTDLAANAAANAVANEAAADAERNAALDVAAQEAYNRKLAEAQAANASIIAQQAQLAAEQADAERRALRTELYVEQERAASSATGMYVLLACVLIALVIGGFYLWGKVDRENRTTTVYAGPPAPGTTVQVIPSTR